MSNLVTEHFIQYKVSKESSNFKYDWIDLSPIMFGIWNDENFDIDFNVNLLCAITEYFKDKTKYFYFLMTGEVFLDVVNNPLYELIIKFLEKSKITNFYLIDNDINNKKTYKNINYEGRPFIIGRNSKWVNPYFYDKRFKKHFICLNGKDMYHRQIIFDYINNSQTLKEKTFLSYEPNDKSNPRHTTIEIDRIDGQDPKYRYVNLNPLCDISFCNIITESFFDNKYIHITEKTDRAFSYRQPFIMVGGSGYLKKLKELGFKTFDRWWDESYDDEFNNDTKIEKIKKIILDISNWSIEKCTNVYYEMESVLQHNYEISTKFFESIGKEYTHIDSCLVRYDKKKHKIIYTDIE